LHDMNPNKNSRRKKKAEGNRFGSGKPPGSQGHKKTKDHLGTFSGAKRLLEKGHPQTKRGKKKPLGKKKTFLEKVS